MGILPDPYSKSISLQDCKAACASDSACQGIIRKYSDGQGRGICYKRRNLVVSRCVSDPQWELYVNPASGVSTATTPKPVTQPPTNRYGCKYVSKNPHAR